MSKQDDKWRDSMPREDRVKVCRHIMAKLGCYYPTTPDRLLKQKTSTFESEAFNKAKSRRDYLEKIAEGLSKVANSIHQQTHQAVAMPKMHPAVGAAAANGDPQAQAQAHALNWAQQQQAQQAQQQNQQQQQPQRQPQRQPQQQSQQRPQAQQPQQRPGVKQEHAREAAGQEKRPVAVPDGKAGALRATGHSLIDLTASLVENLGHVVDLNADTAVEDLFEEYSRHDVLKAMFASLKSSTAAKNVYKFVHKIVTEDDPAADDTAANDTASP